MSVLPANEPADPVQGQPGHFAWSRWIKQAVKALDTAVLGKVAKAGDLMTGPLVIEQSTSDPQLTLRWNVSQGGIIRPGGSGETTFRNIDNTANAPIAIGEPTSPTHAATKGYVDDRTQTGDVATDASGQAEVTFPVAFSADLPAPIVMATYFRTAAATGTNYRGLTVSLWAPSNASQKDVRLGCWIYGEPSISYVRWLAIVP